MADAAAPLFRNFWLDQAFGEETDAAVAPPLAGDVRCDVLIVGGGYTGLWTAIELKTREPSLDVRIIEKEFCGWGASGRNSGYLLNFWAKYPTLKSICGEARALEVGRAGDDAIEEVVSFCADNGIDAEIRRQGWLWGATLPSGIGEWRPITDELARHQVAPLREISGEEIADRWGVSGMLQGALDERAAHLQPAKLVRGLRRVALERGVVIHEGTAMTGLERRRPVVVTTERGRIAADKVVLAMYAWCAQVRELRRSMTVTGYCNAVSPAMPERLAAIGFDQAPCMNDTRYMINALRPTASGRVLFGKPGHALAYGGHVGRGFEEDTSWNLDPERRKRELDRLVPGLAPAYAWSGPIDRTRDGLPMFGRLPGMPDILYATGYSGDGVGPCRLAGKVMASLALDHDDEWGEFGLIRGPMQDFPVEPLRWIGVKLVRRSLARTDDAAAAGRTIGPVARWLNSQVAAGVVSRGEA